MNEVHHDIDVFICGLFDGSEEIVTQTAGAMYEDENALSVEYFERFEGDLEETRNTLTIKGNTVHLYKIGPVSSILHFEQGMTHNTVYHTPEGDLPMEIATDSIKVDRYDTGVDLEINYQIIFEGMDPLSNRLKLKMRYKDNFIIT